ncbi:MAG: ATP-binding protein, partial [Halieaceae bacterium]|nr:ATP-binding protein [Halieaceae bacterium]
PGIPSGQHERLMQRFQRGESQQTDGAGLGLSIVQQICDRYRFELTLTDNPSGPGLLVAVIMP